MILFAAFFSVLAFAIVDAMILIWLATKDESA